jgi:hypothetical protein
MTALTHRYDPWHDLYERWPGVVVLIEPMTGDLLGQVRGGGRVIALRAGTSSAQRRCTLAHEIVHLERGLRDCGRWLAREEAAVHAEAARRLIDVDELAAAVRAAGADASPSLIAHALDVDTDTLLTRLDTLTGPESGQLTRRLDAQRELWALA